MTSFLKLCFYTFVILLLWTGIVQAGQLADRLAQFPQWEKPSVTAAKGDLVYPHWMQGTWNVTSTLIDLAAPLAPEVVTPGFEGNRRHLNKPVSFLVRFRRGRVSSPLQRLKVIPSAKKPAPIVADRVFNALNIGRAYLGDRAIQAVKLDPHTPNRQITLFRGDRQLVSVITGRGTEAPSSDKFVAKEVSQQVFRGTPQIYFNTVETTTAYHLLSSSLTIEADQVTAVYLSPQDANYFKALEKPVALYRYRLQLIPVTSDQ